MDDVRDINADYDEHAIEVGRPGKSAAGVRAVLVALRRAVEQMGLVRTVSTLARVNQRDGFDCPGCAWPEEPGGRKRARVL